MPRRPVVIVGAGLTGLSCALHLRRPYVLLEGSDVIGGAAASYRRGGFCFDRTGHWLHLRDPAIRALVLRLMPLGQWRRVARRAAVYSHGRTLAYPFQAHLHGLPPAVIAECLLGYFAARERAAAAGPAAAKPASFAESIARACGDGIARHFMLPYNEKLWTVHPRELAPDCGGRFVPVPAAAEVVAGALGRRGAARALGYNTHFLYPRRGGIGALAEALARALPQPVRRRQRVVAVNWRRRTVRLADGAVQPYAALVSTMPLPHLVAALTRPPAAVRAAAARLRATQLTYWDVGLDRPHRRGHWHWAYFAGPEVPFYRVGAPSAVAAHLAPPGHASFQVEVAHPAGQPCPAGDAAVLAGLRRVGLVGPAEVPVLWARQTLGCAYVIVDHAHREAREVCLTWMARQGIVGAGRYGAWIYDAMEGALAAGRDAAAAVAA